MNYKDAPLKSEIGAAESLASKTIKNKDILTLARTILEWSLGLNPELDIRRLISSICEAGNMGKVGRAIDTMERLRGGVTRKVIDAYYDFVIETECEPSKRDIAQMTGCAERTVQVILDEYGLPFTRMKPWQQSK